MKDYTHWTITVTGVLAIIYGFLLGGQAINITHGKWAATVYALLIAYTLCSIIGKLYQIEEYYLDQINSRNRLG